MSELDKKIRVFGYTGAPRKVTFKPGTYTIECWGASGGGKELSANSASGSCGKGGYSKGDITFTKDTDLYLYIGQAGGSSTVGLAQGGWNGGGCAWATDASEPANGGGGATDIRLIGGEWDDPQGLLSRIIVAGGGGGGGEDAGDNGQAGGGTTGGGGYGGSQTGSTSGGAFGKGAHTPNDGGAGGGGWYGGGTTNGSQTIPTANSSSDTNTTASGGSGYVYTSTSVKPSGYTPTSEYYFINPVSIVGSTSGIPNPDHFIASSYGLIGDGYVRITGTSDVVSEDDIITPPQSGNSVLVKVNGKWKKSTNSLVKVSGEWK